MKLLPTQARMWKKMSDVWRAGFCAETVKHVQETWGQPNESELRIAFMAKHAPTCLDCSRARWLKAEEGEIAKDAGEEAYQAFLNGEDVIPKLSNPRMLKYLEAKIAMRPDAQSFIKWMEEVRKRDEINPPEDLVPFRLPGPQDRKATFISGRNLVVELYLTSLNSFRERNTDITLVVGTKISKERIEYEKKAGANKRWALLSQARIFTIPATMYLAFHHLADQLTTKLCGWKWEPPQRELELKTDKEVAKYMEVINRYSKTMWPEKFPFKVCYLAIDPPLELNDIQKGLFGINDCESGCDSAWLYAFFVSESGEVVTLSNMVSGTKAGIASSLECTVENGVRTWAFPLTLSPWVVTWLIEWINEHQVTVEERTSSFSYRNYYKKSAKGMKLSTIPAPYYTITMREDLIHAKTKNVLSVPRKHWELQYRHDVRGCNNCRVMRGPLPLDPELEKELRRDKRRKIYIQDSPDPDTERELSKRGVSPKRSNEWMAVLIYWRKDHIKGPPDAPFIPAIRKSARKKTDV